MLAVITMAEDNRTPRDWADDSDEPKSDEEQPVVEKPKKALDKMNKQELFDTATKLTAEQKDLANEIKNLKDELAQANKIVTRVTTERDNALDELTTTTARLDDEKKLTEDLLEQLDIDSDNVNKKKAVLLIMDCNRLAIKSQLGDAPFDYTISTTVDTVSDIDELINGHLEVLKSHDKVVLSCGLDDILQGENGRAVATSLLKAAEKIVSTTGTEVAILAVRPSTVRPGQVLLCNTRLAKMPAVPGIDFINLDQLEAIEKSKIISEDNCLTPEGAKVLMSILNNITVTGTKRVPKQSDDNKENNKPIPSAPKPGPAAPRKDSTSSDDDQTVIEETAPIKHSDIGRIIGFKGDRISSLRAKTGANIYVQDKRKEGWKKSLVLYKGRPDNVSHAKDEIDRIVNRSKPSGSSPIAKKPKK